MSRETCVFFFLKVGWEQKQEFELAKADETSKTPQNPTPPNNDHHLWLPPPSIRPCQTQL